MFKLFESQGTEKDWFEYRDTWDGVLDTIDDICLELKDNGFRINYGGAALKIRIDSQILFKKFKLSEIIDDALRLQDYLSAINFLNFNSFVLLFQDTKSKVDVTVCVENPEELENYKDYLIYSIDIIFNEVGRPAPKY